MAKPRGTDGSLLASLPWTLAALLVALIPHVQFLPIWITAAFLICGAWRYFIERRRRSLPSTWLRALLALTCFLGVLATYSSVSGVGPGSALLAIMAALKLLETRKRRDQYVLLFISVFLVMSSLLREQYLWSLPYLIIAILLVMTAWLRMSATRSETAGRSFRTASRLIAYSAPLAIAMWIFFPRIATPFWAVPIDTSAGTSGLSDTMSPGDISSLSLSDAVAFRVSFDGPIPLARDRYWRGLVLHHFSGRSWSGNDPGIDRQARGNIEISGDPVAYTITLEPTRQQWVFALDIPYNWTLPRTNMGRQQQLWRVQPIDQRVAYDAVSYTEYRSDVELQTTFRNWYLDLPDGTNPQTTELARQMYAEAGSKAAFVEAVLQKFHQEEYFYTLEPPQLGRNPVDEFLFDTRQGFCEHYASAFAVMMRSAGIPARIVLGYQGGELNSVGQYEYLIVRQADAHAWTEVWIEGVGWHRVDPTAAVAPERIDAGMSASMFDGAAAAWGLSAPSMFLHNLGLSWDAINAKWNDWVLGYGPENQDKLMEWLGMEEPDWRKMMLTLIGIVIGMVLLISLLLALRYRPSRPDKAALLYRKFVKKSGVALAVGETPVAFAARAHSSSTIDDDKIDTITAAYLAARYGSPDPASLQFLENQIKQLR
ncbi:MAG: transglutaminase TgpA family protein [Woeseiaceae bacterium]